MAVGVSVAVAVEVAVAVAVSVAVAVAVEVAVVVAVAVTVAVEVGVSVAVAVAVAVAVSVAVALAVGVSVAVDVAVAVWVAVAVVVGVAVAVGVGAGIDPSKAPMSQAVWPAAGRGSPRWSVAGHCACGIAAIAGLVDQSAIVCVSPPLFCRPLGSSRGLTLSPIVWSLAPVLLPKPQELSSEML